MWLLLLLQAEHVAGDPLPEEKAGLKPDPGALHRPFGMAFDGAGTMYIVELEGGRLLCFAGGKLETIAGREGKKGYAGDGGPAAEALFNGPHNVAATPEGVLYVSDTWNHAVRRIDTRSGKIDTIAGGSVGFVGDGGGAKAAKFNDIMCVSLSPDGGLLYATDLKNRRIRAIDLKSGVVNTVAGNGEKGVPADGAAATAAPLVDPRAAVADSKGNLYVLERGGNALRRVSPDGKIATVVKGDLSGPKHLCVDSKDRVIIADEQNLRIVLYDPGTGAVKTLLGRGTGGRHLSAPHGVTIHGEWLYVADSGHHRVLRMKWER